MALADVVVEATEPAAFTVTENRDTSEIAKRQTALVKKTEDDLRGQGFPDDRISCETFLNCRYQGTSTQLMIEKPEDGDYEKRFYDEHKREFGFNLDKRDVIVDDIRVRAVGKSLGAETRSPYQDFEKANKSPVDNSTFETKKVYFDGPGWKDTVLIPLEKLQEGAQVKVSKGSPSKADNKGPAIIYDATQTILVEPTHQATALAEHVIIDLVEEKAVEHKVDTKNYDHVDPVQLSVYGHRLMGIAEQMGDILRKISISLNIKERLD